MEVLLGMVLCPLLSAFTLPDPHPAPTKSVAAAARSATVVYGNGYVHGTVTAPTKPGTTKITLRIHTPGPINPKYVTEEVSLEITQEMIDNGLTAADKAELLAGALDANDALTASSLGNTLTVLTNTGPDSKGVTRLSVSERTGEKDRFRRLKGASAVPPDPLDPIQLVHIAWIKFVGPPSGTTGGPSPTQSQFVVGTNRGEFTLPLTDSMSVAHVTDAMISGLVQLGISASSPVEGVIKVVMDVNLDEGIITQCTDTYMEYGMTLDADR